MSAFSGRQFKGAARVLHATKVREAVERQAKVVPERTRAYRLGRSL